MPNTNEKQKPVSIATPSVGILRKLLGDPLSSGTAKSWPELEKVWAGRQQEFPVEAARVNHLGTMGPVSRWLNPEAYGVTGPFGSVKLNQELIQKEGADVGDILAHELTHVGQGPMAVIKNLFGSQRQKSELENAAINAEAFRKVRKGDIELYAPNLGQKRIK